METDKKLNFGLSDLPDLHLKGKKSRKYLELPFFNKVRDLDCLEYDGDYVVEGDIILSVPKGGTVLAPKGNFYSVTGHTLPIESDRSGNYLWPNGVITYESQFRVKKLVENAIAHWEERTPFRFVHLSDSDSQDFVSFIASDQNASHIGRQGKMQVVKLESGTPDNEVGWAIHEIGHVIGLYHEHCRVDRNDYIAFHPEKLRNPVYKDQFKPIRDNADTVGDYDYLSQMHYPEYAFAILGEKTLTRNDGVGLGKRTGLSSGDINACQALYPMLDWPKVVSVETLSDS